MRILLVAPSQKAVYGRSMAIYPPLGLLYLASALETTGHDVRVADVDAERLLGARFMSLVRDFRPRLIGLTATTPTYPEALRLASQIRAEFRTPIVIGGPHVSALYQVTIMEPNLDVVAIGEAEQTIVELASAIDNGEKDLSTIAGIAWKRNGEICVNRPRSRYPELDTLPFPARHLLHAPDAYRPPDALRYPFTSIMTSRGCSDRCSFCATPLLFGQRLRLRSAANIMAEIETVVDRFKVKEFHIADDVFTVNRHRTLEICRQIVNRRSGLSFFFMNGLRADQTDDEILHALRAAGFQNVAFGVETIEASRRDDMNKRMALADVTAAIDKAKALGFSTWLFFIIGLWGESDRSAQMILDFAKHLNPDYAKFFIFKPLPGTPLFSELDKKGLILSKQWEHYGFYSPPVHRLPTMSPERMMYWHRRANRSFYLHPKRVFHQICKIRSLVQLRANLSALLFLVKSFV